MRCRDEMGTAVVGNETLKARAFTVVDTQVISPTQSQIERRADLAETAAVIRDDAVDE